ncbi:unnamed protein product [Meloidogyne enterolobii]|uniref:Uncharacterized protein n=1 Tax=Meloidogyne enterolobii TaxID=390850 RepID=A0ACB1B1J9_MELEN
MTCGQDLLFLIFLKLIQFFSVIQQPIQNVCLGLASLQTVLSSTLNSNALVYMVCFTLLNIRKSCPQSFSLI